VVGRGEVVGGGGDDQQGRLPGQGDQGLGRLVVTVEVVAAQRLVVVVEHVEEELLVAAQLHHHLAVLDDLAEGLERRLGERLGVDRIGRGHAT